MFVNKKLSGVPPREGKSLGTRLASALSTIELSSQLCWVRVYLCFDSREGRGLKCSVATPFVPINGFRMIREPFHNYGWFLCQ